MLYPITNWRENDSHQFMDFVVTVVAVDAGDFVTLIPVKYHFPIAVRKSWNILVTASRGERLIAFTYVLE